MNSPPRTTSLLKHFEIIASGEAQVPHTRVTPDKRIYSLDGEYYKYYALYEKNLGTFNHHALASIPYILEQCLRMGIGVCRYAKRINKNVDNPLLFYGTSSADGTHARTLAEYAMGTINTLSDSPNLANEREFNRLINHNFSHFYRGAYTDITKSALASTRELSKFSGGFDVIWENTTFQMYSPNRRHQMASLKNNLVDGGVMIFLEKVRGPTDDIYKWFEHIKDVKFKSKYFSSQQICDKDMNILLTMKSMQVTYRELIEACIENFKHVELIWSSCNFCEIVASDDLCRLRTLVESLPKSFIPAKFINPTHHRLSGC